MPPQPAHQSNVVRCIDEDLHVKQIQHPRLGEYQYPLNDDDRFRIYDLDVVAARVSDKIIERHLDRQSPLKRIR